MKMVKGKDPPSAKKQIFILGPMNMQNELLAKHLAESTGATCLTGKSLQEFHLDGAGASVILLDCQGRTAKTILADIQLCPVDKHMVLLFNLSREAGLEKEVVNKGVRGFLSEQESFDKLPRAVRAICNGELWLSRKFMSRWILSTRRNGLKNSEHNGLTSKEMQILRLIAEGASNRGIAEVLFISANTAKTHVYNIFRKIHVTNRLQAALWARKNL